MKRAVQGLLLSAATIFAASSAIAGSTEIDVASFDEIDIGAGVVAHVEVGGSQSVVVEQDDDLFDDLSVSVRGSTLVIKRKNAFRNAFRNFPDFTIYITAESLEAADVHSGANVDVTDVGASDFDIDLSSGGILDISGSCTDLNADVSTGGVLDAENLICDNAEVDASTGGVARIHASSSIDLDASTGADITVYGSPDDIDMDTSTGADISFRKN